MEKPIGDNIKQTISDSFMNTLIILKVTLIVLFIMITIIYMAQENKLIDDGNIHVYTMLHSKDDLNDLIKLSSMDGIFGALSFIVILASRGGMANLANNIFSSLGEIIVVALILFMFRFTQESSGFNRWLTPDEPIYHKIDAMQIKIMQEKIENNEMQGKILSSVEESDIMAKIRHTYAQHVANVGQTPSDMIVSPFKLALQNTAFAFIGLFILLGCLNLFRKAGTGFLYNMFDLEPAGVSKGQFALELLAMFVLNSIPSLVAPKLYNEKYTGMAIGIGFGMGGLSVVIHVLLQYAGLYSGFSHNK